MIRSLMASTALLALVTTGALAQQQPADQTQTQQPQAQQPAQQPGATDEAVRQTQQAGEVLAEDLVGETVYSARTEDAEDIGEISDLVLDQEGNVTAVVIGVGGFLGIGEREVAINYEELELTQDQNGELRIVVAATREQLEAAPEFEETDQTRLYGGLTEEERGTARLPQDQAAQEQQPEQQPDQQMAEQPDQQPQDQMAQQPQDQQLSEQQDLQAQDQMAQDQMDQQPQDQMAQDQMDQQQPDQQMAEQPEQQPQDQMAQDQTAQQPDQQMAAGEAQETRFLTAAETGDSRATDWIGQSIVTAEDEEIGEVRDLLVEDDGMTEAVLVDVSGFLETDKEVAVPFDVIQVERQEGEEVRLVVNMSRDELEQAPAYQREQATAAAQDGQQQGEQIDLQQAEQAAREDLQAQDQAAQQPQDQQQPDQMAQQQPDQQAQDQAAQQQQGQQVEGTQQTLGAGEILADDLIGQTVYSDQAEDAEEIGQISDLVVDEQGDISAAVIGVGGFLGIGEKNVAVDFEQLHFTQQQEGEMRIVAEVSREELETAQAFEDTEQTRLYGELSQEERSAARMPERQQDQEMAQQPDQQQQTATGEAQERQAARAPGVAPGVSGLSADELMGANVIGANNEDIGDVNDVILSQDGQIRAVIVDVGGFLGIGAKEVAIEFESAELQREQDGAITLFVAATQEQLEQAPEYQQTAELQQDGQQPQGQQPAAQPPAGQQPAGQQPADQPAQQ